MQVNATSVGLPRRQLASNLQAQEAYFAFAILQRNTFSFAYA
jgi:hypothetical protein